jgi:hypothetical protein
MTRVSFGLYSGDSPHEANDGFGRTQVEKASSTKPGEATMENENDTVGGYAVPVDPMDLLQCDSCQ